MLFKKKKKEVPVYAVALQKEIDEIMNIVEEQQKQIELLDRQFKELQELCLKGMES